MYNKKKVRDWLEQWNQNNVPLKHHPYRVDDYLIVLGECTGIIVYPRDKETNKYLTYEMLGEDDGSYFLRGDKWSHKDVSWLTEDIKCMEAAQKYIEAHASPMYYVFCGEVSDIQCGWQMPWKD